MSNNSSSEAVTVQVEKSVLEALMMQVEVLSAKLKVMESVEVKPVASDGKKNHREREGSAARMYERVGDFRGKTPQAVAIATVICDLMDVGQKISERELFSELRLRRHEFPALANSTQDPTYLFMYFRGLHDVGFVATNFIRG